jgi:hypothetical protein
MKRDAETNSKIERRPSGQDTPAVSAPALFAAAISKSRDSEAFTGAAAIAKRLMAEELRLGGSSDTAGRAAFRVCEKLRPPLSRLIGVLGFRSLFSRALTLARAEVPWLGGAEIAADGVVGLSVEMQAQLDSGEAARGGIALIAQLLGLLVTFIGEALTLRLVQNVWPETVTPGSEKKGNSHEKAH